VWFATYTALTRREVQSNVSGLVTNNAGGEKPADFGKALLCRHAVGSEGIGAGQAVVHRETVRKRCRLANGTAAD
jgi:hypothetical protein